MRWFYFCILNRKSSSNERVAQTKGKLKRKVNSNERVKENKKRENAFREALNSYMQTFMKEETPEEDKITSYEYTGFGVGEVDNENKLAVTISFKIRSFILFPFFHKRSLPASY